MKLQEMIEVFWTMVVVQLGSAIPNAIIFLIVVWAVIQFIKRK